MKVRVFAAAALVAALAVVAVGASGASGGSAANSSPSGSRSTRSPVGRMSSPRRTLSSRTRTRAWDVNVQYQTWGTHLAKFDATLAGGNAPDVIEMGNTEMTKYMAAGAFQDLTPTSLVRRTRARGSRASRRRAATAASSTASRTTRARASSPTGPICSRQAEDRRSRRASREFTALARKLGAKNSEKTLLAGLHRGHRLVLRDELRLRLRRHDRHDEQAASGSGRSTRRRRSPASTAFKNFFNAASRASKTTDEAHPNPYDVYATGPRGVDAGPGWFSCCVGDSTRVAPRSS